jgi:uncharacterized tellurite resistance protein B-like protein
VREYMYKEWENTCIWRVTEYMYMKSERIHVYEEWENTCIWRVREYMYKEWEYMYKEWENTCIKSERIHV